MMDDFSALDLFSLAQMRRPAQGAEKAGKRAKRSFVKGWRHGLRKGGAAPVPAGLAALFPFGARKGEDAPKPEPELEDFQGWPVPLSWPGNAVSSERSFLLARGDDL